MEAQCPFCDEHIRVTADGICPYCGATIDTWELVDEREATSAVDTELTNCPMCGSSVRADASSCSYCGEELSPARMHFAADGLWHEGQEILVMHKDAELPARCVKSNQATQYRLKRSLSWHHPAWYLVILVCGLIPYVVAALIVRKTATIHIGLSDEWQQRRRNAILVGWTTSLLGIALIIGGIVAASQADIFIALIPLGVVTLFVGMLYGLLRARMVAVKCIRDNYVWLKGVNKDFLAQLPQWNDGI